jgi:hypothetical protein
MTRLKFKVTLLLTLILMMTGCVAKNVVSRVSSSDHRPQGNMKGVFYALPRTVATVGVPIKKTHKEPGEFLRFSRCFFPNEDPIEQKSDSFSVGVPTFTTRGEPDPTKVFMASIQGNYLENKTMEITLTDDGVLTKANVETTNTTLDFVAKAIKTGISIGAQAAGAGVRVAGADKGLSFREQLSPRERQCYDAYIATRDMRISSLTGDALRNASAARDAARALDAAERNLRFAERADPGNIAAAQSIREQALSNAVQKEQELNKILDAASQEIADPTKRTGKFTNAELRAIDAYIRAKTDVDDFERAKEAFDRIAHLHGQRESLISNANLALPADTLKAMLKEIDETIETLQSKFLGSSKDEDPWVPSFEVTLADSQAHFATSLLELSKDNGVCAVSPSFSHIVVPPKFQRPDDAPCTHLIQVMLRLDKGRDGLLSPQLADTVTSATFSQDGERGFYYRIPAVALARVETIGLRGSSSETQTIEKGRSVLSIAQLGTIASLPASSNGRKTKYAIDLNPDTGALKTFTLGSEALIQNSLLEDASAAATSINDLRTKLAAAKEKEKEAAAAKSDQLTQLQRTSAILELQVKIKELEEKLKTKTP